MWACGASLFGNVGLQSVAEDMKTFSSSEETCRVSIRHWKVAEVRSNAAHFPGRQWYQVVKAWKQSRLLLPRRIEVLSETQILGSSIVQEI